jgi:6-phosphogluconolactonase (cycloisomerase 2 family)
MKTRFTWILGVAALVSAGLLVACSSKYTATSNGLIVVSTQASAVMDTFSLNLGNGHIAQIFNVNGPPTPGVPTSVVLAPGGAFAYVLVTANASLPNSTTGIAIYQVSSDGKLTPVGSTFALNNTIVVNGSTCTSVEVSPAALITDSAGKFLFVANSLANGAGGSVSVLAVASDGSLAEVNPVSCASPTAPGSPFPLPAQNGGAVPNASALAVTPTIYPPAFSLCSANTPPTAEYLYVTDSLNDVVLDYSVSSGGVLALVAPSNTVNGVATGTVPSGVTVDPCNRFVYVSNGEPNNSVSAYTICSVVSLPTCTQGDFSLQPAVGSPFAAGTNPGALLVDPLGNFLYVLDQGQNAISAYSIKTVTGGLTPLSVATVATSSAPMSMAIRSDDTWMFVTNLGTTDVSQYAITPSTGVLTPQTPFQTDGNPWGVAVK